MTNCSLYTHNHIRCLISFHFDHFRVKFGLIRWMVEFCFVFAAKTHAVSVSIRSACRSIFLQTSCFVDKSKTKNNTYNLHAFPLYFNEIISYSLMIATGEKRADLVPLYTPERRHLELMKQYIYHIIPLAVPALIPPALWYCCNMHIQLLCFKIRCL